MRELRRTLKRAKRLQPTLYNREYVWRAQTSLGYWTFKVGNLQAAEELLLEITSHEFFRDFIAHNDVELISACQILAAVEACLGHIDCAARRLQGLAQLDTETGIRLSEDQSLRGRQDFITSHLNDPELLMRDL